MGRGSRGLYRQASLLNVLRRYFETGGTENVLGFKFCMMHCIVKSCWCVYFLIFCSQLTMRSMDSKSPLDGDRVLKSKGDRNFVRKVHGLGEEVEERIDLTTGILFPGVRRWQSLTRRIFLACTIQRERKKHFRLYVRSRVLLTLTL